MKTNSCNYSDNWQPYKGDYDKFEYDIKLHDGTIVENCYPNAREFHSISDEHNNKSFKEIDVSEIRFSQRPRYMINGEVSGAKPDQEYFDRIDKLKEKEKEKTEIELLSFPEYDNVYSDIYSNLPHYLPKYTYTGREVPVRVEPKIGRNEICPKCDSGKKYKKCCIDK